nr:helix-turn-helix domain-containing protein [Enterococcus sp. BWB1-3]
MKFGLRRQHNETINWRKINGCYYRVGSSYCYTLHSRKIIVGGKSVATDKIDLDKLEIYSAAEAAKILGKEKSYIRQIYAKYPDRFPPGSVRKVGREYLVTKEAIEALKQK